MSVGHASVGAVSVGAVSVGPASVGPALDTDGLLQEIRAARRATLAAR
ncbi:hypothetical protein J2X68_007520 [Streptomyces sp. 3330]|nr:hypothetical protein [Streptomyces sp. 3330]MDR6980778.1 hypothetical protein [Streptomyces sp. 3330]